MRIDQINKSRTGVEAVSTSSAQSATLCQRHKDIDKQLRIVLDVISKGQHCRLFERILMDLMLSGGLRVSEVLDLREIQVNALGQVYIAGRKGSDSKLVTSIYFSSYWKIFKTGSLSPFIHISRFSFYKWLRTNGIGINHGIGRNNSVTHSFRHLHIYLMEIMNIPKTEMSEIIGHKSKKSLKYYLHEQH